MEQWLRLLSQPFDQFDRDMQAHIYQSFRKLVYRDLFFITQDHALTEDAIQEAFLKLVAKASSRRHDGNPAGWARKVARNTALDMMRRNKKYRHQMNLASVERLEAASQEENVASIVEHRIRVDLLHQAIRELNPEYRMLLLMHYVEGKSYRDIAEELRLSVQAVAQRLLRARKKLLQHFSRKWVDRHESQNRR
mgnify:CR=1 FL=1|jgi:RNA polymerase sigma-70 factor (ECF subfamily)